MSISHDVPAKRRGNLTYEHYCQLPDDGMRHEIINGLHYMNSAPVPYHQRLSRHIQFQLFVAIEQTGLGAVIDAPIDVQFSNHDVVQPDIIVVLSENDIITDTRVIGPPDLVVEILSPASSDRDEGLKKELYEQNGVPEYWIVDPKEKLIRKFVPVDGQFSSAGEFSDTITFNGLPDVSVNLTQVW